MAITRKRQDRTGTRKRVMARITLEGVETSANVDLGLRSLDTVSVVASDGNALDISFSAPTLSIASATALSTLYVNAVGR